MWRFAAILAAILLSRNQVNADAVRATMSREDLLAIVIRGHPNNTQIKPEMLLENNPWLQDILQNVNQSAFPANWNEMSEGAKSSFLEVQMRQGMTHRTERIDRDSALLLVVITLFTFQSCLWAWRKFFPSSYQIATSLGMWIVPIVISSNFNYTRMVVVWAVYSLLSAALFFVASTKPLPQYAPRIVYTYFLSIHKLTKFMAIAGQFLFLFEIAIHVVTGVDHPLGFGDAGLLFIFYSLYYGCLNRDVAEIATNKMASAIGYFSQEGMAAKVIPSNTCAVCSHTVGTDEEKTHKLQCGHLFHDFCLRGWLIVGKKDLCPYCKEKVDLQRTFSNPWERMDVFHLQLLEIVRYFVVWFPIVIVAIHYVMQATVVPDETSRV